MTAESASVVFDGEISGPPTLVTALNAAAKGCAAPDQRALLETLDLFDGDSLPDDLQPIAAVIASPILLLRLDLALGGVPVSASGWLDRDQAVVAVSESTAQEAAVRLLCFPTVRLPHALATFLALGPRPRPEDAGVLVVARAALEGLLGSRASTEQARADLELDQSSADPALTALCRDHVFHWRLELTDAATTGGAFSRVTETVDAGEDGLWLIAPSADEGLVLIVPASMTELWRLLTTMLPTEEETDTIGVGSTIRAPPRRHR